MQAERFGHQVVGAAVEAAHPRVDFLPAGEYQYRQVGIEHAHLFEHLLAVFDGQVQVQNG